MSLLIDPDRPETWPDRLRTVVGHLDAKTKKAEAVSDLRTGDADEPAVREVLAGAQLVAFHATRLLPHEVEDVRHGGLRAFSRELFDDRIDAAVHAGALGPADSVALHKAHMFATGEHNKRGKRGGVCLTLRQASFDHGAWNLLAHWGGEGLYASSGAKRLQDLLRTLGSPAIVRVAVSIKVTAMDQRCWPTLDQTLLGSWRGMREGAALFHPDPLPGSDVLDVWHPGDTGYDSFPNLPKA
jgi:hypothetical protein